MYYGSKDSHGGKPATRPGLVSRLVAWRMYMGGDINVTSQPGKGATFTLTVHAPAIAEEVEDTLAEDDSVPLPALNVLLVEDIELNVIVAPFSAGKTGVTALMWR